MLWKLGKLSKIGFVLLVIYDAKQNINRTKPDKFPLALTFH